MSVKGDAPKEPLPDDSNFNSIDTPFAGAGAGEASTLKIWFKLICAG
jgi:hypothetical protein